MATTTRRTKVRDDYLALIRRFALAPIRDRNQYEQAVRMIDDLSIIDEERLTPGQADYLAVLTDLIEAFELRQERSGAVRLTGLELLKFLLQENQMTASDLGRLLGNRQLGSAVLRGQRQLSKVHIRKVCERFKVSADLFLQTSGDT